MATPEQRFTADRRRRSRGGRRETDFDGQTPLVLVVGAEAPARTASEAVLARLRFAVATSNTTDEALRLMPALRPDVVVVPAQNVLDVRSAVPETLRVVVMREDPESLVEAIRRSLAS